MKKYLAVFLLLLIVPLTILAQQTITVSGTVIDTQGEPMIGVNITVRDVAGLGTITDINGKFTIKMEPYHRLLFTYIGYEDVDILVKEQHVVNVTMKEAAASELDEVVVTGMGTQKKLTVTGAVTNVDVQELKRFPSSNLSNALAGNVPGIMTQQTSGQPGKSTSEFWIRGISTFGASSSAYILVDGFERASLDELNIEDIESFTVLKDASATAIYGSKGANGVVLITTKRGKAGKINIDAKVETSYNTRTITPEFVDGFSYANLMNEALVTRNKGIAYQPEELELFRTQIDPDFYPIVDWKDLILKDGAWSYRANLNMSGGGNTARYYVSASYTEDQGMYKTDETLRKDYDTNANYKRWNYRMNIDIDITKSTVLKLGVAGSLATRNSPALGDDNLWGMLFGYNSIASPVYYSNGYTPISHRDNVNKLNPWVASTQSGYKENWDNNVQTNITLEQNFDFITKGLKFVGRFGFDTDNSNWITRQRLPDLYKANGRDQATGEIIFDKMFSAYDMQQYSGSSGKRREFVDLLLSWERGFKEHHTGVTLRYTQDAEKKTVDIGTDIKNGVAKRNQGLAGRATYNWNYRYFVDFNFGYTGSENFAPGHQFGFFPAFSVAWNVAEEPFVKNNLKWMNMFKIRYSHGKVGNDNLGEGNRFPYLYTIGTGASEYNWGFGNYNNIFSGTHYTQMASTGITWEVATKDDLGVDLSLFNDKFTATVDYFHEKRTGIFMSRAFLPDITGLESQPKANVGEVKTYGFDGNFAFKQKLGEVDMTLRGNITYSKNEVIERDEENQVYSYLYQKGYRVDQVKGLIAEGLFADYDDIRTSPKQAWGTVQPGDIKYKDVNGDGIVNDQDRVAIGATTRPNLGYGIGASFAWRGFDFNIHFQGVGKSTFPIYGKCVYAFSESDWGNIFKDMIQDRWVDADTAEKLGIQANENPNATYPRLTYGENSNNQQTSTYWMRNGKYIRLKNIDLGYTLPKSLVNKMHFNNIRVYIAGSNLITWSDFKTWDPESTNPRGEDYPLSKSVTMGITVNL
ncbi:SusC/RagA family TonB-linked outer membrane protein [Bacteroides faecalis]|uniref:SusC/RagA family TonB-linked outer membrane protein n=1 Tax=Bacteroides faecalis TaxID=2447885 RepID=A0A401LYB6_9BACE|nr:TonB-dependent receptor [Bacteroides faecalis]GCB36477.1 SusC/RagA family TonB-linked outer membrane protein [Bacteroides faecalis]